MVIIECTIKTGIFAIASLNIKCVFRLAQQGCFAVVVVMQGLFEEVRCALELKPGQISGCDGHISKQPFPENPHDSVGMVLEC